MQEKKIYLLNSDSTPIPSTIDLSCVPCKNRSFQHVILLSIRVVASTQGRILLIQETLET